MLTWFRLHMPRSGTGGETRDMLLFGSVAVLGFMVALSLSAYALWIGWDQPIIDQHGFRQTQTALAAYWLLHGGDWLAYETPVLGSPWSIPMEKGSSNL